MNKNIITIVCVLILMLIPYGFGVKEGRRQAEKDTIKIESIDTMIITDTLFYPEPVPQYIHEIKHDTVRFLTVDSVYVDVPLSLTQKVYQDSTYKAWVSGFNPSLDSLYVKQQTTTVFKTIKEKEKIHGIKIYPSIGVGYGIINKKPDLFAGVSLTYHF